MTTIANLATTILVTAGAGAVAWAVTASGRWAAGVAGLVVAVAAIVLVMDIDPAESEGDG